VKSWEDIPREGRGKTRLKAKIRAHDLDGFFFAGKFFFKTDGFKQTFADLSERFFILVQPAEPWISVPLVDQRAGGRTPLFGLADSRFPLFNRYVKDPPSLKLGRDESTSAILLRRSDGGQEASADRSCRRQLPSRTSCPATGRVLNGESLAHNGGCATFLRNAEFSDGLLAGNRLREGFRLSRF
jgi:hypothetical protein